VANRNRHRAGAASRQKLVSLRAAAARRGSARRARKRVVFTNGCFDLLHAGHVEYLEQARRQGDLLIVGLNSDASVRRLKGADRPLQPARDRARVLAGLEAVDLVVVFGEDTPAKIVRALRPDILVKGADWKPGTIVGADTVEQDGGRVVRVRLMPGISTSAIVSRIRGGAGAAAIPLAFETAPLRRDVVSATPKPVRAAARRKGRRR